MNFVKYCQNRLVLTNSSNIRTDAQVFNTIERLGNTCLVLQDEDIYTFFEPNLPLEQAAATRVKAEASKTSSSDKWSSPKQPANRSGSKASQSRTHKNSAVPEKKPAATNHSNDAGWRSSQENIAWHEGSSVLDLKGDNYFSCAVGRKRSSARYLLVSSDDVVSFLKELATESAFASSSQK